MKKIFVFISLAFTAAGCSITEKVVFNSKMGGTINYAFDATEFMNMMQAMDTTGTRINLADSLGNLGLMIQTLNGVSGISDVKFEATESRIEFGFAFSDISSLNKAHNQLGVINETLKNSKYEKVSTKGKKELIYRTWPLGSSPTDSSYASMAMLLTYNLEAEFPKTVNSVNNKSVTGAGNKISWTSSAEDNGATFAFDGINVKFK
jgi:hypothetical protein